MDDEPPNPDGLFSEINDYYVNLLGYSPEKTSLKSIPNPSWILFCFENGFNPLSLGIYLPRNQTAIIPRDNELSLFHEYFGHGLYCEQSLSGKKLIDLEKKLLEEEKKEFQNKNFTLNGIKRFRSKNKTAEELKRFKDENLIAYESFAVWTEYLLSKEFGFIEKFEKEYYDLPGKERGIVDSIINFSEENGNLAAFYAQGMARKTSPGRVKKLLEGIYGEDIIKKSKLILLSGSKKTFSDIDIFASSNYLQSAKNEWLDLVSFNEEDFDRRIKLFEIQVTYPIIKGEFVAGDKKYFKRKKQQLQEQPITEEAIQHNLTLSKEQELLAEKYPINSKERKTGLSYSKSYLENAIALKNGKREFSKDGMFSYSQGEKFIEMKGGIVK